MWLIINATNKCDLNCKTCLRSKYGAEDVDPELLRSIIPKLRTLSYSGISITGGEPIMHPKFSELVKMIVSEGFHLGVVSNGILYKEYIKILEPYKERVFFAAISLDSHKKEINDYIRGKGSFESATKAIREFKKRGFFVKVSHVVNKKNLKDLEHFVDFALNLGADVVNVLGTIKTPENMDLVLDEKEKKDFHVKLRFLEFIYEKKVFYVTSTGYFNKPIFCDNFNNMNDLTLDFMGNLIFCCDTIHSGAVLGNLKKEKFEKLIDKCLKTQSILKAARIKAVMNHKSRETNDCDFCNRVLKKMIKD